MTARSSTPIWLTGSDQRGWDHMRVHVQLLKDKRLGAYELGVYLGLCAHAETQSGRCFPAAATLAEYIDVSEKTVRRATKVLIETGYVRMEQGNGTANTYHLNPLPSLDSQSTLEPGSKGAGLSSTSTLDCGTDEQEPIIRSKNKSEKASKSEFSGARFPAPRDGCDKCDGGIILHDDNTAEQCSCLFSTV